jgi:hypothetical protein
MRHFDLRLSTQVTSTPHTKPTELSTSCALLHSTSGICLLAFLVEFTDICRHLDLVACQTNSSTHTHTHKPKSPPQTSSQPTMTNIITSIASQKATSIWVTTSEHNLLTNAPWHATSSRTATLDCTLLMAASAQDNSKSAVPQTYTNTQGKEGWNITGLHLDGGFGSGQFMCAAPTKQTKGWDTGKWKEHKARIGDTWGRHLAWMVGEGKHMA